MAVVLRKLPRNIRTEIQKKLKMPEDLVLGNNKQIRLILPFKLPTWNQLLAMNQWERKRVRDWIKDAVSMCIQEEPVSQTPMVFRLKPSLMELSRQEYYQMIQPNSSKKYHFRRKLEKTRQ